MTFSPLYRSLGIKTEEIRTVGLFFLHHFFLGFGTMLIYVSANVILLENHPETSLPLAYMASAVGMMAVGKTYAYFEHHLLLDRLAIRVLWAVIVLTGVILALVYFGHSIAASVAIMVGFRAIYLLTNLEFWGVSAVVFDVRQSKRLFGVISAGDMPAKALGGMLAVLIHGHSELLLLLFLAFGFFWAAMYTAVLTFRSHQVTAPAPAPLPRRNTPRLITQLFGGSQLIFAMCLSITAVSIMATGVEYAFFINVKYKLHSQAEVMKYLGIVLTMTYLLATFVKLVVSRQTIEYFGINHVLALLPVGGLAVAVGLSGVFFLGLDQSVQLIAYCFVYLGFEVVRRALFDPVFLVLFQPLSTHQRLRGHTLAKGFYEPLGLGIGGVMLYLSHHLWQGGDWFLVEEIVVGALFALWFLQRTYRYYVQTLQEALSRRFVAVEDLAIPDEAVHAILKNLKSDKPKEVINAIEWLVANRPSGVSSDRLYRYVAELIEHPQAQVQVKALETAQKLNLSLKPAQLKPLLTEDVAPPVREAAAVLLSQQSEQQGVTLLYNEDLMLRKGAIKGLLNKIPLQTSAITSLEAMQQNSHVNSQLGVLDIIQSLQLNQYSDFVKQALQHPQPLVVSKAIETASMLQNQDLIEGLLTLLENKSHWREAARSLASVEQMAIAMIQERITKEMSIVLAQRFVVVAGQMTSHEGYELLVTLVQRKDVTLRTMALGALHNYPNSQQHLSLFQNLLQEEFRLVQHLLYGQMEKIENDLQKSLLFEQEAAIQRIFGLLMQQYDQDIIRSAQTSVLHSSRERRANSLELLENLVPRQVYGVLHALLDNIPDAEKVRLIDLQIGLPTVNHSIKDYILEEGTRHFTDWTIRLALRGMSPEKLFQYPDLHIMSHSSATAKVSITERVMVLRNTELFSETPRTY
ncbi:MAG: Crp/Fnr family transcriptional regulator [Spirosomataceae bacterium]